MRSQSEQQVSDAAQRVVACDALVASLKEDVAAAGHASHAARAEVERHRAVAHRLAAANDTLQAQLAAALEPVLEAPAPAEGGRIKKKVRATRCMHPLGPERKLVHVSRSESV